MTLNFSAIISTTAQLIYEEIIMQHIHQENAQAINNNPNAVQAKKPFNFERPGRLVNRVELIINTAATQKLLTGSTNKGDVGLLQFAGFIAEIWKQAERDDPFADWYLVKIYDAMVTLKNQLAAEIQLQQQALNKINGTSGFIIKTFSSEKPLVKTVWFKTPYGYLGAQIIAVFDELVRTVMTASNVGVILDKGHESVRDVWAEKIIALFKLPLKWQAVDITRDDVIAKNDKAKAAQKALGKLPEVILTKKLRSPFAPKIIVSVNDSQLTDSENKLTDEKN